MASSRTSTAVAKKTTPGQLPARSSGPSLLRRFAARYGIEENRMLDTLKATAFRQRGKNGGPPPEITNEQMVALLTVAERYDLDPFVRQIYAFPNKAGGIEPIVPIDGWLKIINNHPQFSEMEIEYPPPEESEKQYAWVKCTIWRKDRKKPTVKIEWFDECFRDTDPWRQMPRRMLEWKAIIQCGRVAFNLSGIFDPDEAERIRDANAIEGTFEEVSKSGGKPETEAPRALPSDGKATHEQLEVIRQQLARAGMREADVCEKLDLGAFVDLRFDQVQPALDWIASIAP